MHSKAPLLVLLALIVSPSLSQPAPNEAVCLNTDLSVLNGGSGTPCAVSHTLLSNFQARSNVPPLPPNQIYALPSSDEFPFPSPVMCTLEMYNLIQGCAACQQLSTPLAEQLQYPSLPEWKSRCIELGFQPDSVDLAQFAANIIIPAWARSPPSTGDTFNVAALLLLLPVQPQPGVTLSTGTGLSTATGSQTPLLAPSSAIGSASASSSSPPIGPIIGGVVAGVVVLLLIGGLVFWLVRRRQSRSHIAPSAEFMGARHIPLAQDDEDDREMGVPMRHSSVGDDLPAFTPGQFKDPIFEKGVAISTGAMPMSSVGHSPATSYSPTSPATNHQGPVRQPSVEQYQSSADAYQSSAGHQYHPSGDQYHSSIDQYRPDVQPHSPHSPEMAQGYRD